MSELQLFTDASVNCHLKLGYGAYLLISEPGCSFEQLKSAVKTKRFEQTSSTKSELQTLLWALHDVKALAKERTVKLTIFTDCQNIIRLPDRQTRLEQSQYLNSKNTLLKDHLLYQRFYQLTTGISCTFIKVKGHQRSSQKGEIDKLFSLVDKAARQALKAAI